MLLTLIYLSLYLFSTIFFYQSIIRMSNNSRQDSGSRENPHLKWNAGRPFLSFLSCSFIGFILIVLIEVRSIVLVWTVETCQSVCCVPVHHQRLLLCRQCYSIALWIVEAWRLASTSTSNDRQKLIQNVTRSYCRYCTTQYFMLCVAYT